MEEKSDQQKKEEVSLIERVGYAMQTMSSMCLVICQVTSPNPDGKTNPVSHLFPHQTLGRGHTQGRFAVSRAQEAREESKRHTFWPSLTQPKLKIGDLSPC